MDREDILWAVFVAAVFVFLIVLVRINRNNAGACEYDERQLYNRGNAYRAGFFSGLIGEFIAGFLIMCVDGMAKFDTALIFTAAFAGLAVFVTLAIWNDAFLSEGQKPTSYLALSIFVVIINLVSVLMNREGESLTEFLKSIRFINLLIVIIFSYITILLIVKTVQEGRDDK